MANEEHIELLGQGIQVWNTWRVKNQEISPDLQNANLQGADLRRADLQGAFLIGANLRTANLTNANLTNANLTNANLPEAILRGANLPEAILRGANLPEAILRGAILPEAIPPEAILVANSGRAVQRVAREAQEEIINSTSPFIGKANLAESTENHKGGIFISYAREDRERARILAKAFTERGWPVWWDTAIIPGDHYNRLIKEALYAAKCVVVLWSKKSVDSTWVNNEATVGLRRDILIPALLDVDEEDIPVQFLHLHGARLVDWSGTFPQPEFDMLLKAVSSKLQS